MSSANPIDQVTAIVKTFERPAVLARLLRSLREFYPTMKVLVGDDSAQPTVQADVDYVCFPFDVGVSAGRNELLARVETEYFLTLDDDFEFIEETRIERLLQVAQQPDVDLAAGNCIACKSKIFYTRERHAPYHGLIRREGDCLRMTPGYRCEGDGYFLCDIVNQFFIAPTDLIREVGGWDARLKTNEHEDFFLRLKQHGLRVAYCPDVVVRNWVGDRPRRYRAFRERPYLPLVARKHGLRRMELLGGHEFDFDLPRAG
jgi:GT2 family glycosyltransferase